MRSLVTGYVLFWSTFITLLIVPLWFSEQSLQKEWAATKIESERYVAKCSPVTILSVQPIQTGSKSKHDKRLVTYKDSCGEKGIFHLDWNDSRLPLKDEVWTLRIQNYGFVLDKKVDNSHRHRKKKTAL